MASADVRSPYGEFAKRQGIIHFAFSESRKLSYSLYLITPRQAKKTADIGENAP
jgi:hypothetical protein